MTKRDKILNKIAENQPDLVPMPEISLDEVIRYNNNYSQFKSTLEGIGGRVVLINDISLLKNELVIDKASDNYILNTIPDIGDVNDHSFLLSASELEKLEKVYLKGTIGVSENGSVWLYESQTLCVYWNVVITRCTRCSYRSPCVYMHRPRECWISFGRF